MRLSKATLFLFVFFIFIVTFVVQSEAVISEGVVSGGGDSGSNSVTVVVSGGGDSGSNSVTVVRRGECEKQGVECEKVNGGNEETDLENEDYIYTNSVLP